MDPIYTTLANYGLGGVMVAAQLWFVHRLITKTIPEMAAAFAESLDRSERGANDRNEKVVAELKMVAENTRVIKEQGCANSLLYRPRPNEGHA